ncbi:MAG: hypothetical protein ABI475_05870 [Methylophilaceae bacterium]
MREAETAVADELPEAHKHLNGMANFYATGRKNTAKLIERLGEEGL